MTFLDEALRYEHLGLIRLPAGHARTWIAVCYAKLQVVAVLPSLLAEA